MSKKDESEISKKLEKLAFRPISKGPLETIEEGEPKKEESKKRPKSEGFVEDEPELKSSRVPKTGRIMTEDQRYDELRRSPSIVFEHNQRRAKSAPLFGRNDDSDYGFYDHGFKGGMSAQAQQAEGERMAAIEKCGESAKKHCKKSYVLGGPVNSKAGMQLCRDEIKMAGDYGEDKNNKCKKMSYRDENGKYHMGDPLNEGCEHTGCAKLKYVYDQSEKEAFTQAMPNMRSGVERGSENMKSLAREKYSKFMNRSTPGAGGRRTRKKNKRRIHKMKGRKSRKSLRGGGRKTTCVKQTRKKYTSRKSPPYPANKCKTKKRKGNDGKFYISKAKGGTYKWVPFAGHKKSKKKT